MVMWLGVRLVSLLVPGPRVPSHTSSPCCSCQSREDKTPSQIGQTSLFVSIVVTLHGRGMCHMFCPISGAPVLVCHSHSRMLIRVHACVNRSTTHTPHLSHDYPARHGRHTCVVSATPTHSSQLVHGSSPRFLHAPPLHRPSVLRPEHVSHTPRVPRETHSHPCSSPISHTLHFSITCSAPHTPHTAPVRRSEALSPPTPPIHPHTSARPAQSVPGFHIENGSHIGHIHCDVTHNSPEKRLKQ